MFCIRTEIDVFPVYVRSEHNVVADGITRRSHTELDHWSPLDGMIPIDFASLVG